MSRAALSLGSNVSPEVNLRSAIAALRARFGCIVLSRVYRTAAVGFDGPEFLNAGVVLDTDLEPVALDAWLHALEDQHGRDRSAPRFGDRSLDIDLVLYDARIVEGPGHLRIPRDELRHGFVLRPLAEIAPGMIEPRSGEPLAALWARSPGHEAPMIEVVGFDGG